MKKAKTCKAKTIETCPHKLTYCETHHHDDDEEPSSPNYSPMSPVYLHDNLKKKDLKRKRNSTTNAKSKKKVTIEIDDVEEDKKETLTIDLMEYEAKRKENKKKSEEKKKLAKLPDPSERKKFRYYGDPSKMRNPIFLEVKGEVANKLGAILEIKAEMESNHIAVEDSLVTDVSSVWRIALDDDPQAFVLPIDDPFGEDVVRCAIYLAGRIFYNEKDHLAKADLGVDLLLQLTSFSFQYGMNDLHDWLLEKVVPSSAWSMKDLITLYKSDLHNKGAEFFRPLPRENIPKVRNFFEDEEEEHPVTDSKEEKRVIKSTIKIGWLKEWCKEAMAAKPQAIISHLVEKFDIAAESVEADLLQIGMNSNNKVVQNVAEEHDFAFNFLGLIWREMDPTPWPRVLQGDPHARAFIKKVYDNRFRRPDNWKLVVNACNGRFRDGVKKNFSPDGENKVKTLVGL